MSITL